MPTFSYQAINTDGSETTGTVEAGNLAAAVDRVRALGLFPRSISPDDDARGSAFGALPFGRKITEARLARVIRELADLVGSNVPLPLSLSILRDRQKPGRLKKILRGLAADVEGGSQLSEAMANQPGVFLPHYVALLRAGEAKGALRESLSSLAELAEKNHAITEEVKQIQGKPLLKFFVGMLIFSYFFLVFPAFIGWISSLLGSFRGSTLAVIVQIIAGLSLSFRSVFFILLVGIVILILCMRIPGRFVPIREIRERIILRLPVTGKLLKNAYTAKFLRTLGTLLAGGIPKTKSFNAAIKASGSRVFSRALTRVCDEISDSGTIVPSLERSGVFPPATLRIMATGEQAGALEAALINAADVSVPNSSMRMWSLSERLFLLGILAFALFFLGSMFASVIQGGSCGSRGGG